MASGGYNGFSRCVVTKIATNRWDEVDFMLSPG
jgi:hypothetical protein